MLITGFRAAITLPVAQMDEAIKEMETGKKHDDEAFPIYASIPRSQPRARDGGVVYVCFRVSPAFPETLQQSSGAVR